LKKKCRHGGPIDLALEKKRAGSIPRTIAEKPVVCVVGLSNLKVYQEENAKIN